MLHGMKLLKRFIKIGFILCLAALAGMALFLFSLWVEYRSSLTLPPPGGNLAVGRALYDWVDPARSDTLADQPGTPRELVVWVWFPGEASETGEPAPYLPADWIQARDSDQGIGRLIEHHFAGIRTHSFPGLAVAKAHPAYPVLIMEPGMGPMASDYTVLAENLASRGYVVFGINPTHTSNLIVFPDGRIAGRSSIGTIPDRDSPAMADADGNRILSVWVQDVLFVLNQVDALNADPGSPFYQRLDLGLTGLFGHSFGGATAFAVCQQDARCKAGANLDGDPFSAEMKTTVRQPFLFLSEDYPEACEAQPDCEAMLKMSRLVNPGPAFFLQVSGAKHFNFSDLPLRQVGLVRPLFRLAGYAGSIDPQRGLQIANTYLAAFFDRYLKGEENGLLSGPSSLYPEVRFIR